MKSYPSIPHISHVEVGMPCVMFYKYDGSNLRFEWSSKNGWFKFGTRNHLFDKTDKDFGDAIQLFVGEFGNRLDHVFRRTLKTANATVYCEYFGPHSFSGIHDTKSLQNLGFKIDHNDPKRLVMFDVNIYKKGFVEPRTFCELFASIVPCAQVVYTGILTEEVILAVKNGEFPVREGVICKGGENHNLWMGKIKTTAYLDELKKRFADKWQTYV